MPGLLRHQKDFKAKGIDEIIVFCVNDGAVMNAWADSQQATGHVMSTMRTLLKDTTFRDVLRWLFSLGQVGRDGEGSMINFLADTSGALTDALGMGMDHPGPFFKVQTYGS